MTIYESPIIVSLERVLHNEQHRQEVARNDALGHPDPPLLKSFLLILIKRDQLSNALRLFIFLFVNFPHSGAY